MSSRREMGPGEGRVCGRLRGWPRLAGAFALGFALVPGVATATPWQIDPQRSLPADGDAVTQKVELVDFDADGHVDLVFANSRGDAEGDAADAQLNQLVRNEAGQAFVEQAGVFAEPDNAYVIKAADVDEDGDPDLVVGVNFGGQSYVLLNEDGLFVRHELSPGESLSIGDLELGDVDLDGDLDIVATDWGRARAVRRGRRSRRPASPVGGRRGGRVRRRRQPAAEGRGEPGRVVPRPRALRLR
ncbi:VCBS repeat-containing protein [Nannocystis sp. RBIL2]|uniref:FG-GAP repeat domain-containing protein n=1 Tax=Nannocystis sp. RBIL2 TaxID=2996788 RepID=UPI00226E597C|nr:VCBS repeat-containing protein [Nannocystis sp. RBIL2]MCY1066364.1 VCBS repeat-containing protein [Nannocystis sp. RBIL2]